MTKSKNDASSAGDALLKAVSDLAGAEFSKQHYGYGDELAEDAQQRLKELAKPLSVEECQKIGVPAVEVSDPAQGDLIIKLRDTKKSPAAVNAHAHAERLNLAKDARCLTIAADMAESIDPQNSIEAALAHQLGAAHAQAMRLVEKANQWLDNASAILHDVGKNKPPAYTHAQASIEAVRLTNAAARMMKAYQEGVTLLAKLRGGGRQEVKIIHQHVQVAGGNVAVAGNVSQGVGDYGNGGG